MNWAALIWSVVDFAALTVYVSVAAVLMVVVRKRAMEITCVADTRPSMYDAHLYCSTLSGHWFGPSCAGVLWPLALVPLLVVKRLYRDQANLARIDRMERELGMRR